MADIIQLLPDSIANQIAAGEVIQRPASVVKELLENAVDAQATEIKLIVKDSGKTLIQVVDDGKGMSESDARMAFERHATSKIRKSEDLFKITTKGFRGEALASIAAIAMVELVTKKAEMELGTRLNIEASTVKKQEMVQALNGSTFSVKNLFYNVPARRKFLKSDPVEFKHIMDEFLRVALAHPEIFFVFLHNENEVYHLPKGNLRQRIINIFGKNYNERVVPVQENTEIMKISGYTGKPEASKKTKGEQFLFVNNRYIKSHYLHHAIRSCYDGLTHDNTHPFYVLFIDLDPAQIDINVHPTKTEIKFEDERLVYNYVKVSVRHALGQYNVTPALNFEADYNFAQPSDSQKHHSEGGSFIAVNLQRDRFDPSRKNKDQWQLLYEGLELDESSPVTVESKLSNAMQDDETWTDHRGKDPYQLHQKYIVNQIKSGFLLIDQHAAHERILYEKFLAALENNGIPTQKQLFPQTIELTTSRATTLTSVVDQVNKLGFEILPFGKNTFVIHGIPSGLDGQENAKELVEQLLEHFERNIEFHLGVKENLARSLAVATSIKRGESLDQIEMRSLIDQLFACGVPYKSPSGKKCFISIELEEIAKRFMS